MLSIKRRVPCAPYPALQRTDVSDSQDVPSHAVPCTRALVLELETPKFAPCTVMEAEPVDALLSRRNMDTDAKSTDHISLIVPIRFPAVNIVECVPLSELVLLQFNADCEIQYVCSHAVCPCLIFQQNALVPMFAPVTVIHDAPVAGTLNLVKALIAARSNVQMSLKLPT